MKGQATGWEREEQETRDRATHFKLARINKRVLKPCDPKVCQSKQAGMILYKGNILLSLVIAFSLPSHSCFCSKCFAEVQHRAN